VIADIAVIADISGVLLEHDLESYGYKLYMKRRLKCPKATTEI